MFAASGIFGNILGGNFASTTTPSVGASGAIRKFYFGDDKASYRRTEKH